MGSDVGKFFSKTVSYVVDVALIAAVFIVSAPAIPYIMAAYIGWQLARGFSTASYQKKLAKRALEKLKQGNGHLVDTKSSQEKIPLVYGTCRVGGNIFFVASNGDNNKYLYQAIGLSEGVITDVIDVRLNEDYVLGLAIQKEYQSSEQVKYSLPSNFAAVKFVFEYDMYIYNDIEGTEVTDCHHYTFPEITISKNSTLTQYVTYSVYSSTISINYASDNTLTISVTDNYPDNLSVKISNLNITAFSIDGTNFAKTSSSYVKWYVAKNDGTYVYSDANDSTVTGLRNYLISTFNFIEPSIPYIAMRFEYNGENFNSVPNVTATIKGMKVLNLNTNQLEYSDNPVYILYDYLVNTTYGLGVSPQQIDIASFKNAATYCTNKGFSFNGVITDGRSAEIVEMLLAHFNGSLVPSTTYNSTNNTYNTTFKLKVSDLLHSIDPLPNIIIKEEDIIKDTFKISYGANSERPNTIEVNFINPEIEYKMDKVTISLLEAGNLLGVSGNDFNSWNKTNCTVTSNIDYDINNQLTADKIVKTSSPAWISLNVTSLTLTNTEYYFSFYAKSENANGLNVEPIVYFKNDATTPPDPSTMVRKAVVKYLPPTWKKYTYKYTFTGSSRYIWIWVPDNIYICSAVLSTSEALGYQEEKKTIILDLVGASKAQARLIGTKALDRARLDTTITFNIPPALVSADTTILLEIGDLFFLSYEEYGINNVLFRVTDIQRDEQNNQAITAIIEDISLYDQNLNPHNFFLDLTSLPNPYDKPLQPEINLTTGVETNANFLGTSFVNVSLTQSSPFVSYHIVEISADSNFTTKQTYRFAGNSTVDKITGLMPDKTYYIRSKAISIYGAESAYTSTQTITTAKDTTPPATPTGLTITPTTKSILITWNANTETDLKEYVLEKSVNDSAFSVIYQGLSTAFTDTNVTISTNYKYRIKAIDISGNASGYNTSNNYQTLQVVTADIADTAVNSNKLATSAVTTDKIQDSAITNAKIADNTITTQKIVNLPEGYNLAINSDFTDRAGNPTKDGWALVSGVNFDVEDASLYNPKSGKYAIYNTSTSNNSTVICANYIPIQLSRVYILEAYCRVPINSTGTVLLYVNFYDKNFSFINLYSTVFIPQSTNFEYVSLTFGNNTSNPFPSNAMYMKIGVILNWRHFPYYYGDSIIHAQGIRLREVIESLYTANLSADKITTGYLSADRIQSGTITADKLSVTSLSAISADLGTVTAGTINGCTITGTLFRTAASGERIEITTDGKMSIYNSNNVLEGKIEGAIGKLYITANSNSSITIRGGNVLFGPETGTHSYNYMIFNESFTGDYALKIINYAIDAGVEPIGALYVSSSRAPLVINPSSSASAPTHSAPKGTLWVTSDGVLYININNGTSWQKVGGQ